MKQGRELMGVSPSGTPNKLKAGNEFEDMVGCERGCAKLSSMHLALGDPKPVA